MEFDKMPKCVREVLLGDESTEASGKIIGDFSLSDEQVSVLFDIIRKATSQEMPLENLPDTIRGKFGFDEEKARKMAVQVAGFHLLPLSDFLRENIEVLIKKWGGNPDDFKKQSQERFELRKKLAEEEKKRLGSELVEGPLTPEEQKADEIAAKAGVSFVGEIPRKRFNSIAISYLKQIRSLGQTKEVLSRSNKIGGMGYDGATTEKIAAALEEIPLADVVFENNAEAQGSEEPSLAKEEAEKAKKEETPEPAISEEKRREEEEKAKRLRELREKIIRERREEEKKRMEKAREEAEKAIKDVSSVASAKDEEAPLSEAPKAGGQPTINQQKNMETESQVELVGPVEELRELKLIDFRRLDADPEKAAGKISQKIRILSEESAIGKIEAIEAWRESEVCGLYVEIGQEALLQAKPLEEEIEDRKDANRPFLSIEEIKAITGLNSKLRF